MKLGFPIGEHYLVSYLDIIEGCNLFWSGTMLSTVFGGA